MKRFGALIGASLALLFGGTAHAIGVLVPTDKSVEPLAIESHRVEVEVKDRTAETKVVQVFRNSTSRQLEAIYTFPLPKGAAVSDFALWMNGKRVSGEVLEKEKAREIYEGIVRRMKDPGLLEYVGNDIFQARVFPIPANGTQKVELSFTSLLPREKGVSQYVYPLKTGGPSARTLADFTLTVKLSSKTPIKNIYSPSHSISVHKKDDYHATVGFEIERAFLEKDFKLYYSLSKDEVGVDLLTYRKPGEPGYFMLLATPKQDYAEKEIIGKHVTFVMDTSGSMSGEKMERARKALIYCLEHLRDDDTFSLIRFSSDVESFEPEPRPATKEWIQKAVKFAKDMEAAGGTAIYDALDTALSQKIKGNGPRLVVFLTDGSPTVGETDPSKIAEMVRKKNKDKERIFVFGVGETVNAILLDRIAADNGGFAEYAKPDAEVELVLTSFYDKIAFPVLADLELEIPRVKTYDMFPRSLGDLYKGQQILLFGRYKDSGGSTITLKGNVEGKPKSFEYEGEFASQNLENDFIPRLWATRKVGYLLEEIRINGEQQELKEEVIRLGKEFGIVTPYTSYLVVEEDGSMAPPPPPFQPSPLPIPRAESSADPLNGIDMRGPGSSSSSKKKAPAPKADYSASTGSAGIEASKQTRRRKDATVEEENGYTKYIDGQSYVWDGARWTDTRFTSSMKTLNIAPLSDAYFTLLKLRPDLSKILSLGTEVTVVVGKGKAIVITASGKTSIAEKDLKAFLK